MEDLTVPFPKSKRKMILHLFILSLYLSYLSPFVFKLFIPHAVADFHQLRGAGEK